MEYYFDTMLQTSIQSPDFYFYFIFQFSIFNLMDFKHVDYDIQKNFLCSFIEIMNKNFNACLLLIMNLWKISPYFGV